MVGRRQQGFSLVELIVVAAIVAILSAIVLPMATHGRERARQSSCINNCREVLHAVEMYAQDNAEMLLAPPENASWATELANYADPAVFDCPTRRGVGTAGRPEYGYNAELFTVSLGDIASPPNTLLIADLNMATAGPTFALTDPDKDIDPRHFHGAVIGFADGHASHVKIVGREIYQHLASLGLQFTPDGSPLPWKVLAWGGGAVVNLQGKGSQGHYFIGDDGAASAARPKYATALTATAAVGRGASDSRRRPEAAATGPGWRRIDGKEGCSARLVWGEKKTFEGAAWIAAPEKNAATFSLSVPEDDKAVHQITVWTPWYHPTYATRDETVTITGGDEEASFTLTGLRPTRGAYVTFSFVGSLTVRVSNVPPADEEPAITFGALLFD